MRAHYLMLAALVALALPLGAGAQDNEPAPASQPAAAPKPDHAPDPDGEPAPASQLAAAPKPDHAPSADEPVAAPTNRWADEPFSPSIDSLQLVTDQAEPSMADGNRWGGHQCRVIRNRFGLFTAYTSTQTHASLFPREWHLMQQTGGGWTQIAHAPSGKEPVNLMSGPDGQIYIVAWPFKTPVLWEAAPDKQGQLPFSNGTLTMIDWPVPGNWDPWHWPYNSTAIDDQGRLLILQTTTVHKPGEFRMSLYDPAKRALLRTFAITMPLRHCYTYILPRGLELWMASIQDVRIRADLGKQPTKALEKFAFNAVTVWHSDDYTARDPQAILYKESHYDEQDNPRADLRIQDAYLDTHGLLHVLYHYRSGETNHSGQMWHMVLDRSGKVLRDARRPGMECYCRMIQDSRGRHYILCSSGQGGAKIAAAIDEAGLEYTDFVPLDLGPYKVTYSGFAWADPRTGVGLSDSVDVVFPAGQGEQWVYFRLRLR